MYNRYIPQPDGSFRKDRVENRRPPQRPQEEKCPPACPPPCPQPQSPACQPEPQPCPQPSRPAQKCKEGTSAGGFLRQLLPPNLDTGDLIVVLLLLLLAGDCEEDRSTALLTLVLYLFM